MTRGSTYATLDLAETGMTVLALKVALSELEPIVARLTKDKRPEWEATMRELRTLHERLDKRLRAAVHSRHFEKVKANAR